jgi:hypothetical protein
LTLVQTPWQREGDNVRCLRHGVVFANTESCAACDADPGTALDPSEVEALPPPPAGCKDSLELERHLIEEAEFIRTAARTLYEVDKSRVAVGTAARLWTTWAMLQRQIRGLTERREDAVIVGRYEKRDAARNGATH